MIKHHEVNEIQLKTNYGHFQKKYLDKMMRFCRWILWFTSFSHVMVGIKNQFNNWMKSNMVNHMISHSISLAFSMWKEEKIACQVLVLQKKIFKKYISISPAPYKGNHSHCSHLSRISVCLHIWFLQILVRWQDL